MKMKIKESAEDYLESILVLGRTKNKVRSIDIVKHMNLSKPSVSVAMKKLRESGCINMDGDGYITLTDEGKKIAEKIYERHVFISQWLEELGVSEETALEDACRIEHVLSDETFEAIKSRYGSGKCRDVRKVFHPVCIICFHRFHPCLLQHDFRDPHLVGIPGRFGPPGQLSLIFVIPMHQQRRPVFIKYFHLLILF